jgi:superfamily II RNA helicase
MLKVSSVSFKNHSTAKTDRKQENSSKMLASQIAYNTVPISSNNFATAKSLISFKGVEFYETLNQNYFKLPVGANPDEYQKKSAANIYAGKDVLVTAPTGTGKTAIAHYAITKNMEDGKRTFYTTPLKALSNEKFRQMKKVYGEENVGLMTGDTKINTKAPIVIMTTEIYRNMVFGDKFKTDSDKEQLKDLKTVIFDELHYLGDVDRGGVWEQSIILSDPKTQLLSLSATIGNNVEINDWMSNVKGKLGVLVDVPPEKRHVPLVFQNDKVAAKTSGGRGNSAATGSAPTPPPDKKSYKQMVERLYQKDRLPAILFVFSKKGSKDILSYMADEGPLLTTRKEREGIEETVGRYKKEGKYLGESLNMEALMKGYAIHNSGLLPAQKQLVEELFQKPSKNEPPLLKVIIATETLAAGINMPARTTVISSVRKPTSAGSSDSDDGKRELSPNEFHQMAGRAGRRGLDTTGYVYTMSTTTEQMKKFESLINAKPNELKSTFNPDFSFVAGYYKKTQDDDLINEILNKSLHAYDKSSKKSEEKQNEMMSKFEKQKGVLNNFGFIEEDNKLTEKGQLLSLLNGYYQIPVINAVYEQKLGGMNAIELAACVGSLANVNEKPDEKKIAKKAKASDGPEVFEHENDMLKYFVDDFDKSLGDYNEKRSTESGFKKIAQNKDVAKHVYAWAELNSKDELSTENWKSIYNGDLKDTIRDEGSLFKAVTQAVDLLKQMSTISDAALELSKTEHDTQYYTELKSTIQDSLKLLRKEPIVDKD